MAVEDQFGNLVQNTTSSNMTVEGSPAPGELLGAKSQPVANGFASFGGLVFSSVGPGRTLVFRLNELSVTSAPMNVVEGLSRTNKLAFVSVPTGSIKAGPDNLGTVTVELQNENSTPISRAGVEINLSISGGSGTLQGNTTSLTDASGQASFDKLSLEVAGNYTLSASSTDDDFPNPVSSPLDIIPDSSQPRLQFETAPADLVLLETEFSVELRVVDPFGNRLRNFAEPVTLELRNGNGLPPDLDLISGSSLTLTPVDGILQFQDLRLEGNYESTQEGYFLRAASSATPPPPIDSSPFSLQSGNAAALAIVDKSPTPTVQSTEPFQANPFQLQVRVLDQFGNQVENSSTTVNLRLDDSAVAPEGARGVAQLTGELSREAVSGLATFPNLGLDKVASGFVIVAESASLDSDRTLPFGVSFGSGPRTLIVDNILGMAPAEGGNGLPNCPLQTLAQALAEADSDSDVNIIEVVDTGTDYPGDVNLAAPGLSQTLVLRGRQSGNPRLTGQVVLGSGDTIQDLTIARSSATEALSANSISGASIDNVTVENPTGPAIALTNSTGQIVLSSVSCSSQSTALSYSGSPSSVLSLSSSSFETSSGSGINLSGGQLTGTENTVRAQGGPAFVSAGTDLASSGISFSSLTSTDSTSTALSISDMDRRTGSPVFESQMTTATSCAGSGLVVSLSDVDFDFGNTTVDSSGMANGSFAVDLLSANTGVATFQQLQCVSNRSGLQVGGGGLRFEEPTSTIDAGGGPALLCQATSFGTSGASLLSVSSSGGAVGVSLTDTLGALTVSGTSGGAEDGSGGTIREISGTGILLRNCHDITLQSLRIGASGELRNITSRGLDATNVDNLFVLGCAFINVGDEVETDAAIFGTNPVGLWSVSDCSFERSFQRHLDIRNNLATGSPTVDVADSSFTDNMTGGGSSESILFASNAGSTTTINISGCQFQDSAGDHIRIAPSEGASVTAHIGGPTPGDGNTMRNSTEPIASRDGIVLQSRGELNYLVQGNSVHGGEIAISISGTSTGSLEGEVRDNTLGTESTIGCTTGLLFLTQESADSIFHAENNLVRRTLVGCQVETRGTATSSGVIVSNDLASSADPVSRTGLAIPVGTVAGTTDSVVTTLDIRSNSLDAATGSDVNFSVRPGCTLRLPGYSGANTGAAAVTAVQDYLATLNTGVGLVTGTVDGTVTAAP